ncbi:sialoadhesin-like isoform X1 [Oncorhynchus keta]|uniref:sialoadhesin-like isoform X1 n=1 Tax=Oncorhynchus keta TaxID=8018 RepID=UPI00227B74E0|nr:sialoadhesin-like isoform X1 [Oncorhynchus keta]XP_052384005.1 sialoadhesin-like isoform X1 [Oncorhynchus keta]
MSLRTAGSVLVVFLWSVAVVLGQDGWSVTYTPQSICTLKGSTVEMSCSYTHPSGYIVTSTFWFTRNDAEENPVSLSDEPDYKGRVTYHKDNKNDCTLRITDLRESDSATYKFRFITDQTGGRFTGNPGVTLSVTDLQVKVTPYSVVSAWKTLTCTTCVLTGNPTYTWYKNGQIVTDNTSPYSVYPDAADSYSCAVKSNEDLHTPAVCVQDQSCNRVTYIDKSICALKGSSVDISCTYSSYHAIKTTFWFRSDKSAPEDLTRDPEYAGRALESLPSTLRITDLRESDSAEYKFRFNTQISGWGYSFPGTTLSVTDLQVKVTPAAEGQKTLTCSTTCTLTDNPTYIWYRNGQRLDESTSLQYSVNSSYSDSYSCAVKSHEDIQAPAVCVVGESCMNVTYTHQSICALKGSTVDISCFYTHPRWHNVTEVSWFSKWETGVTNDLSQDPEYADRVKYHRQTDEDSTLTITDLRERDSTEYKFRFKTVHAEWGYTFSGTTLSVTGLQVEMTPATVTEGQRVTLACRTVCTLTDNPNPSYIWYKLGQRLTNQNNSLILNPVSSEDAGRYSCAVEGFEDLHSPEETLTVKYGPKNTLASIHLSDEIVEGSSVTLTCISDANPPVDKYTWYKKIGAHYQSFSHGNTELQHVFSHIQSSDTGEYYCEARNEMGTDRSESINIDVKYGPKSTLVSVSPSGDIVEGSSVTLTCSSDANPPVQSYAWYKNGSVYQSIFYGNTEPQQVFSQIKSSDTRQYYCWVSNGISTDRSPSLDIDVKYAPKSTSVSVSPAGEIVEGNSVTLTCSSDANPPVDKYTWYKKNVTSPKASGQSYSITNIISEDRGEYYCEAENKYGRLTSSPVFVDVQYDPKNTSVSVSPSGEIVEGSSVTLTCSSDANPPVQSYTWYKTIGYQSVSYGNTEPQQVFNQIKSSATGEYYCEAWNGIKTGRSESINIDVKYGPKNTSVSVSPSGDIVEGSSVTLTCSSDANPPVDKYTWYKKNVTSPKASGQSYSITNIISEDRGEYYCEAENKYGRLTSSPVFVDVQYGPKNTSVSVSPSGEIVEGSSVTLTCSSDANPPVKRYTWYKKSGHQSVSYGNTEPQQVFNQIKSSATGEYYCEAWNGIKTGRSESINIDVKYGPKNISVSVSPSGDIVEGSSVTLTCSSDANPPVQSYTWWYKKNGGDNQSMTGPQHVFNQIQSSDTGEYYCEAWNGMKTGRSEYIDIDVKYSPKNLSVSVSPSVEITEGSPVTLTCSSDANPPVQIYIWYKTNGAETSMRHSGWSYRITNIIPEDRGEYYCLAVNEVGCKRSKLVPLKVLCKPKTTSVSVSPSGEIVEGSSVTLTCSSDANPPVDKYTWYKKNGVSLKGSENTFLITNINSEDSGEYYCEAENEYGGLNSSTISVDVQYGPKNTSVSVSHSGEIVEGSSVSLTCSSDANPPVQNYTWYKKNVTSPVLSGQNYNITNISSEDSGHYLCEARNKIASENSTALKIIVAGKHTSIKTAAVGIIIVVLVLILCLSGFMWFRTKASKSTSIETRDTADEGQGDSTLLYDNMAMQQRQSPSSQDDVPYTSVHVSPSKNQEELCAPSSNCLNPRDRTEMSSTLL